MVDQLLRQDNATRFDSVAAVFAVDLDQRIVSSTPAADAILGRRHDDGLPCHEVMRALDTRNTIRCRPDCTEVTAARRGWTPRGSALWDAACRQPRTVTTLVEARAGAPPLIIHVLGEPERPAPALMTDERPLGLTRRQVETLRLLALGVDPRGIALTLGVSPITVRNHVQTAMERLNAHTRLEAVMLASRAGLL